MGRMWIALLVVTFGLSIPTRGEPAVKHSVPQILYHGADPNLRARVRTRGGRTFLVPIGFLKWSVYGKASDHVFEFDALSFAIWLPSGDVPEKGFESIVGADFRGRTPDRAGQHIVKIRDLAAPSSGAVLPNAQFANSAQGRGMFMKPEFGLLKFGIPPVGSGLGTVLYGTDPNALQLALNCIWPGRGEPTWERSCHGYVYSRADDIMFHIHFLEDEVKNWKIVAERVLEIVRSWEVKQ